MRRASTPWCPDLFAGLTASAALGAARERVGPAKLKRDGRAGDKTYVRFGGARREVVPRPFRATTTLATSRTRSATRVKNVPAVRNARTAPTAIATRIAIRRRTVQRNPGALRNLPRRSSDVASFQSMIPSDQGRGSRRETSLMAFWRWLWTAGRWPASGGGGWAVMLLLRFPGENDYRQNGQAYNHNSGEDGVPQISRQAREAGGGRRRRRWRGGRGRARRRTVP